jgi:hypothetical protein
MCDALAGEEVDEGLWDVCFGPLRLGRTNERILRIKDNKGRTVRKTLSSMSLAGLMC